MAVGFYQQNITTSLLRGEKRKVASWIKHIIEKEKKVPGNIAIVFTNKKNLLALNRQHLNHDYYTDIITFNYNEGKIISGDLFVSIDRIKENSIEFNAPAKHELLRVIIHGIFHLLGFNDKTENEQKKMRTKEDKALSLYI